ncbi:hypothetical protein BFW38_08570 [Terasakiispira papahanaumokuakeensis]|uniref:DUF2069 domain-containing protein n=1 Tax=Terasakiispira papahanaumokuakeensis TaxID=197479 RepID=A0A1E2V997_9GAMM|nr:DUF2069 domain-containing protein [Terasakiispira papahanaumokuakeensis]ODC03590.1 hypothetical protein BFW38_08570 [Terasakiispira papahanaumokuakeensis]
MKLAAPIPHQDLQQRLRFARPLVFYSYILLLGLQGWQLANTEWSSVTRMAMATLLQWGPLLIFIPALIKRTPRDHAWLCFVSLGYFMQGIMNSVSPESGLYGGAEALLALILFISAMLYTRWRSMELRGAFN